MSPRRLGALAAALWADPARRLPPPEPEDDPHVWLVTVPPSPSDPGLLEVRPVDVPVSTEDAVDHELATCLPSLFPLEGGPGEAAPGVHAHGRPIFAASAVPAGCDTSRFAHDLLPLHGGRAVMVYSDRHNGYTVTSRMPPEDWESELKAARLELLALIRAIGRLQMDARALPQPVLHELFDLDGDNAEALSILDQPSVQFDMQRNKRHALARASGRDALALHVVLRVGAPRAARGEGPRDPADPDRAGRVTLDPGQGPEGRVSARRRRKTAARMPREEPVSDEEWVAEVGGELRESIRTRLRHLGLREVASLDRTERRSAHCARRSRWRRSTSGPRCSCRWRLPDPSIT